jgi:hypothetical protein
VSFTTDSAVSLRSIIYVSNVTGDGFSPSSYTANGYSGIYIWGAQLEAGAFATSYIPTVASQVTRSADDATLPTTGWFRGDEGTIYGEGKSFGLGTFGESYFLAGDLTDSSSRFNFHIRSSGLFFQYGTPNRLTSFSSSATVVNTQIKAVSAYKTANLASSVNAGTPTTNTSSLSVWTPTSVNIGSYTTSTAFFNGNIRKIAYYPARLTNAELQGLTTV